MKEIGKKLTKLDDLALADWNVMREIKGFGEGIRVIRVEDRFEI